RRRNSTSFWIRWSVGSSEKAKQINTLLTKRRASTVQREKKTIRCALRALGHTGGLRGSSK
ncbi:MAG: hypothetical protein ACYTAO_21410, partial [Planctomycetota bacterium]